MGSEIPEWAMTEAQAFHDRWETGMSGAAFQEFARALVAAERRGIERAVETVETKPMRFIGQTESQIRSALSSAIRQLGETP